MPNPADYDNEKDFISACIPIVHKEHPDWEPDRVQAVCYSMWRERNKKHSDNKGKILLELNTVMFELEKETNEFKDATILVGDGTYRGVYFPAEELEKAFMTWENQPINLDHSERVEDEVGFIHKISYDKHTRKLTAKPVINDSMPNAKIARAYIEGRNRAGTIPEVSVGVYIDRIDEELPDGNIRATARNLIGDHLAIVTRGACSPHAGCGIGLSEYSTIPIDFENIDDYETLMCIPMEEYDGLINEIEKLKLSIKIMNEKLKEVKKE